MYAQKTETLSTTTLTTPLVSVADVRRSLGLDASDTAVTELLTSAVNAAFSHVQDYLGRMLPEALVVETFYHPSRTLNLSRLPATGIRSIVDGDGQAVDVWSYGFGVLEVKDREYFKAEEVVVTYTGGFTLLPYALLQGIEELAKEIYLRRARSGVVSAENLEGIVDVSYLSVGMPPHIRQLLDAYRIVRL